MRLCIKLRRNLFKMRMLIARCIYYVALALAVILCFAGALEVNYVMIAIGAAVGLFGLIVWIIYGRCPECGEHLGRRLTEHCPHCGEKIE